MGFNGDLMGFNGDLMGYVIEWDIPSGVINHGVLEN